MKLGLSISGVLFLTLAFVPPAIAVPLANVIEVDATTQLLYFTSSNEKMSKAQIVSAEDNLTFQVSRDPRAIARDLARDELQNGNVCLTQAAGDLKKALKKNHITRLCRSIFKDDIAIAAKQMRQVEMRPDYLRCAANFEARETEGSLQVVLAFRGQLVMNEKLPGKLPKAGFTAEPKGWALPQHEEALGDSAANWKGVLKNGSCGLDEDALMKYLDRYLAQAKERRALAYCRSKYGAQLDRYSRLQGQFREYVPDEWLKEVDSKEVALLLRSAPGGDTFPRLQDCKAGKFTLIDQLKRLRKISAKLADKHDVPALDPANQPGSRELASEDEDF